MDSQTNDAQHQLSPQVSSSAPSPLNSVNMLLLLLVLIALVIAGTGGGYWLGHASQSAAQSSASSATNVVASSQSVHFVESLGYSNGPAGTPPKYQYLIKLGIPSSMQSVKVDSTIQNQGIGFQIFGDGTFGYELGRWELGTPNNPADDSGSEISLMTISDAWLSDTGNTDFTPYTVLNLMPRNPLETPSQKHQFMSDLVSTTSACAKDSSKGFQTRDGSLNICYGFQYGKEGYEPTVTLIGYGKIQDDPVVLVGYIAIYDNTPLGSSEAAVIQAVNNANAGHPTAMTAQAQKALLDALKQTTITVSANHA